MPAVVLATHRLPGGQVKETLFEKVLWWHLRVLTAVMLAGFWGIVIYSLKLLITEALK